MGGAKKESIIAFPEDYVVIDIETTGMSPKYDEIIELSAINVCNNQIQDHYSSLVQPPAYLTSDGDSPELITEFVPEFITELTGITNQMLSDAPTIDKVLPEYLDSIGDQLVIGHNVSFDINFIRQNSMSLGLSEFNPNYTDTLRICRKLFHEKHHHRLKDVVKYLDVPYSPDLETMTTASPSKKGKISKSSRKMFSMKCLHGKYSRGLREVS
ncbi:PolC-type DNA polymerase III [Pseudoramibacter alactolyticus]|uniref:3'-5' exonuclease n=1 Tax=Pseudoramibacter alactolyticus TaxID=113287 RepID=UPI002354E1E1|nr:exonuclease domain-containing protein [Pseudoramibacter alactolyticus]MBM6968652.1 hypothetical protein [Pseudoramibacter alactolyticus]